MTGLSIAIVGATGAVGREFLSLLESSTLEVSKIRLFASQKSIGSKIRVFNEVITVEKLEIDVFRGMDIAFFCAGERISREWASAAIASGAIVIDNSSAFRMDKDIPLVIPEINIETLKNHKGLIANPNCTTIIFLMGIYEIYRKYGIKRGVVATYQAVSGSGQKAVEELRRQTALNMMRRPIEPEVYPHQIAFNVLPQCGEIMRFGNTVEEDKLRNESRKILDDKDITFSTTCVRVPVYRAHSISATLELGNEFDVDDIRTMIEQNPNLVLEDKLKNDIYPNPLNYSGKTEVGVGRIRHAEAYENGLSLWIVGDQVLRGAAYNAIKIAEGGQTHF
ncbi:MAG: aspartate-semialdehyde dehydrogenase [Planctomycetes bacterium]|nr:aspartate-semialdehyde dehydrogenase [Planctomycetota bacterium]